MYPFQETENSSEKEIEYEKESTESDTDESGSDNSADIHYLSQSFVPLFSIFDDEIESDYEEVEFFFNENAGSIKTRSLVALYNFAEL